MLEYMKNTFFSGETHTLSEWQEKSLTAILLFICLFSIPVLVRSLLQAVNDGLYLNLFLYSACYVFALGIAVAKSMPFTPRAWSAVGVLFAAGVIALFTVGPLGSGRIFLFASGIFATVILGIRAGLVVSLFQFTTLFSFAYLLKADFYKWSNIELYSVSSWVTSSTTFCFLSLVFIVAIGRMIGGLSNTFSKLQLANEDLEKFENRFSTVVENANDIVFEVDATTYNFSYVSSTCKTLLGYEKDEVVGSSFKEFLHEEYVLTATQLLLESLQQGTIHDDVEYKVLHKDGTWRWHLTKGGPLRDTQGRIIGFVGISRDVTERKEIEEELLRAKNAADAATRAKSEFLANMSHEIRTPLNGVMGMLQLMQMTGLDQEQEEYADTAIESCKRLVRLLTDILDISRIEARMLSISYAPMDVAEVLSQTSGLFSPIAREGGVELRVLVDPGIPGRVFGDAARLQQVLSNLVGNALKFTHAGSVSVGAAGLSPLRDGQCRILFSVADTGIGIPDEKLGSLFQPFTQVSEGFTRNYQGAGLGLSICKRLVDLMGGNISVVSESGVGTTVYFSLHFRIDELGTDAVPVRDSLAPPALQGLRVLLAEDDRFSAVLAEKLLAKHGALVQVVEGGQQALDATRGNAFDIILMDIQMPGMDGIEATHAIRDGKGGSRAKGVPIIAMTAYAMGGDRDRFLAAGMDGYVSKPFEIDDLLRTIEHIVHRKIA